MHTLRIDVFGRPGEFIEVTAESVSWTTSLCFDAWWHPEGDSPMLFRLGQGSAWGVGHEHTTTYVKGFLRSRTPRPTRDPS